MGEFSASGRVPHPIHEYFDYEQGIKAIDVLVSFGTCYRSNPETGDSGRKLYETAHKPRSLRRDHPNHKPRAGKKAFDLPRASRGVFQDERERVLTKTHGGTVRKRRRAHNAMAKRSRRRNRR